MATKSELQEDIRVMKKKLEVQVSFTDELQNLVSQRDATIAEIKSIAANNVNTLKAAINEERKKTQKMEAAKDDATNTLRNMASALGKSQEMDPVEACKEAARELGIYKNDVNVLENYLNNHGLAQKGVSPCKIAMQTIEALINEAASEEQ